MRTPSGGLRRHEEGSRWRSRSHAILRSHVKTKGPWNPAFRLIGGREDYYQLRSGDYRCRQPYYQRTIVGAQYRCRVPNQDSMPAGTPPPPLSRSLLWLLIVYSPDLTRIQKWSADIYFDRIRLCLEKNEKSNRYRTMRKPSGQCFRATQLSTWSTLYWSIQ